MIAPVVKPLPVLALGLLLATPSPGCKYLVAVDTTNATIVFAFSGSHPGSGTCAVRVVDGNGAEVRTLTVAAASASRVAWDLRDDAGRRVPGGTYGARLYVADEVVDEAPAVLVSSP